MIVLIMYKNLLGLKASLSNVDYLINVMNG